MWNFVNCSEYKVSRTSSSAADLFVLQLDMTFHLFICALAGAGAAVIAMVRTPRTARASEAEPTGSKRSPSFSWVKERTDPCTAGVLSYSLCSGEKEAFWCREKDRGCLPPSFRGLSYCCHGNREKKGSAANITL